MEKNKAFIVVTGCPRSGTSLMMDSLRLAFGDDKIIGIKFPFEERYLAQKQKKINEAEEHYKSRMYLLNYQNPNQEEDLKKVKNMNPNGFWECKYTCSSLNWHPNMTNLNGKILKIVSNALAKSNPEYIENIIFMARHPRQVAKSQESLRRRIPGIDTEQLKVHSPQMFIDVTIQVADWMIKYGKDIPFFMVEFDKLLEDPDKTFTDLHDFLGCGDFSNHPVNKKLKRSEPREIENELWIYAEEIYKMLLEKKWKDIINYAHNNSKNIFKQEMTTFCTRNKRIMSIQECILCKKGGRTLIQNMAYQAENKGSKWRNEPCMYDCLFNYDNSKISIEESIKNNHWTQILDKKIFESTSSIK